MKTTKSKTQCLKTLFLLSSVISLTSVSLAAGDTWTKKADMPTARFLLGTCVLDGKIYAIGGAPRPYGYYSVVEEYDPVTDTWAKKTDMPTARVGLGTSVVNGKIYAIGGGEPGIRTVEEYDPDTDTWTRKADMPTARGFLSTSVVNGKIYVIGGATSTSGPALTTVEEYDPATDAWARKADLPEPRYLHAAGVVDDKIYIIAGSRQEWTASQAVYEFDPTTDTWERKADAPTARAWLSASAVNGRIYVIGGDFSPPKAVVEEYNPATDTWTTKANMPTPRGALSTSVVNDKIYVIGGTRTIDDALSTVEEYEPKPPLVVDFNGDGIVDSTDLCILVDHWGENYPLCDIGPTPFGDGIVDVQDLIVLAEHLFEEVSDPTLIAHWPLDETKGIVAYDSVSVCDGTLMGGAVWQPDGGMIGGALEFNGTTFVTTDFVLNPGGGPFSLIAWVNGGAPGQVIISQADGANWLSIDPVLGTLMTELKGDGRFGQSLYSDVIVSDGAWHRIGFTWDDSTRRLYVDDAIVAEDTQTGLVDCFNGLNIGCGNTRATDSFWSGLIDDVRIYKRVVSP